MDKLIRVLVVDDSAYVRKVVKEMLLRSPFIDVVGTARDGEDALELVTLDLTMKDMYGLDVLARLREMDPRANVVIASADIQSSTHEMVKDAGAAGFIGEPFVAEAVLEKISAALKGPTP